MMFLPRVSEARRAADHVRSGKRGLHVHRQHPLASPQVRRSLVLALVVGTLGVAFFVLGPTGEVPMRAVMKTSRVLGKLGFPAWATSNDLWAFVYNIALFVPVVCVCALLWRRVPVTAWVGLGFLGSLAIETVQALFLAGRTPEVQDLVANTSGALVGAILARLAWWLLHRADRR